MKKICSLFLLTALLTALLCSCSAPIIYEEEKTVDQWLKARTEGYQSVPSTRLMYLYNDKEGFIINIGTGTNGYPDLEVEYDPVSVTAEDTEIISLSANGEEFAVSTHINKIFDPYANQYAGSMRVYQKDEKTFRIFFWLCASDTDFYPFPTLLTEDQYQRMLEIFNTYTEEQRIESENLGENPVNYAGIYMSAYEPKYVSERAENPEGKIFYQYNGTAADYVTVFSNLFAKLEMTQQDWRASYESLGYTGDTSLYQIVYCDLSVGDTVTDLTLQVSDAYTSEELKKKNLIFTYTFCPNLSQQEFMNVTQK